MLKFIQNHIAVGFFSLFLALITAVGLFIFLSLNYNTMREYVPSLPNTESSTASPTTRPPLYGVSIEMNQILPRSPKYIKNEKGEDLIDIASDLGVNLVRITNSTELAGNESGIYTSEDWKTVLNKMQTKGMKAIILIENSKIFQKNIPREYHNFANKYILDSNVLQNPDVYAVDLYNEPAITQANISLLSDEAAVIKNNFPQIKLTVGWWAEDTNTKDEDGNEVYLWNNYALGKVLEPIVDFYSVHMYGFDRKRMDVYPDPYVFTQNFIHDIESGLQTKKPILIEEFGAANGETISDQNTLGSPMIQANVYNGVYKEIQETKDPQILGTIAYQLISKTSRPDAWAIIKDNGNTWFPAAYILQRFATNQK